MTARIIRFPIAVGEPVDCPPQGDVRLGRSLTVVDSPQRRRAPEVVEPPADEVRLARYRCAVGHCIMLPVVLNEHTPAKWECRCGLMGDLMNGPASQPVGEPTSGPSHWGRVRRRRTAGQLQALLDERLDALRLETSSDDDNGVSAGGEGARRVVS